LRFFTISAQIFALTYRGITKNAVFLLVIQMLILKPEAQYKQGNISLPNDTLQACYSIIPKSFITTRHYLWYKSQPFFIYPKKTMSV